jgi:phosphoribosyl-ATP pyrophosphohydrolase/phosphoribosyl-AMP cyclohydrolase
MKLTPVIVQDVETNNVLMMAWADREALRRTRRTGWMHYWSRSRGRLWKKGESSGHVQRLVELLKDCDGDTLLARVRQKGPACHLNRASCFTDRVFTARGVLDALWATIEERRRRRPRGSYTARLLKDRDLRLKKLLEEAAELALAAAGGKKKNVIWEAADLIYHALVVLAAAGVTLDDVDRELARRFTPRPRRP